MVQAMTDNSLYRDALEAAKSEMESLLTEQTEVEKRLSFINSRVNDLKKTILSLGELVGEEFEPETMGITDAIRKVMRGALDDKGSYISPISVRNFLQKDNFPLSAYKNPLAVIHTTLKRLEEQLEVQSTTLNNGKTYYRWNKKMEITDDDIPF